jgi:hypothetical protein
MQPTPMKQQNLNLMNRKKDTDWRRVTQRKENYENQMGKWVWFIFYYSFHLLNLELSATNLWGCRFWGEPPKWVSVEKHDARTLHMISSCFADLFQNSLQIIQSVPVVFLHPVALFDSCQILMYCVLLPSWSCKNIGQGQATNQSLLGCVFCGWLIIHCCSPWPILVFYN